MLTLGLDVGSSSVGWALIESDEERREGRVVGAGVRVFPEGVDRDQQGGEQSKSQTRRTARGMRRQHQRRGRRIRELRSLLTDHELLPKADRDLERVLALNPYSLRAKALDEPLEPYEIGRIFLHLSRRRGFLSNRKTDREKEEKGMLAEISTLQRRIDDAGCRTLGEYLHGIDRNFSHRARSVQPTEKERRDGQLQDTVRRLHTRRDMYIDEFEAIWEAQKRHHPDLLTDDLKSRLYDPQGDREWVCKGLIFGQRRMYWPKAVVGKCDLERNRKRCMVGERCAQRFRILQEVRNLKLIDHLTGEERELRPAERATLVEDLSSAKQRTFDQIRKRLGLTEHVRFNLEGPERSKLKGHITDATLSGSKAIGKKAWAALPEATKDIIARIVLEEEREEEGLPKLMALGLTRKQAEGALGAHLPDSRAAFSREAIEKLLPHLEQGKFLMGNTPEDSAIHAAGYLRPDERAVRQRRFLPAAPDLPNPVVRQAMVEVRRVVNAILREICDAPPERGGLGGRRPDAIHIELAREAKKSFEQRQRMRFDNADRNRAREAAKERIEEYAQAHPGAGVRANRRTIQKYLLWQEQGEMCPYRGCKIGVAQLLSDATDIDHVLPRWRSLDDSMMNKVVCFREENHAKGQRTPAEWLADEPARWERVLAIAKDLPYPKYRRFLQRDIVRDDFVNRQFQDTAYISRAVMQYLRCLGVDIVTPRGGMTAELRRSWGLNNILSDDGEKNRQDHRHHAVDAAVIALTTRKRLHALAIERGEGVTPPWQSVRADLGDVVSSINVSYRTLRRLRGALHEETIYGATQKRAQDDGRSEPGSAGRGHARGWVEADNVFVRRKPVASITDLKHIAKVRDRGVRLVLKRHLEGLGVDTSKKRGALPKKCFEGKHEPRMPSGVPIRRVRMVEESETFRRVRAGQFVKPGSNHHVVYRAMENGDREEWKAEIVTMWDAAIRARAEGKPTVDRSGAGRFVMSLSIGEAFQMDGEDGERLLCVVQKLDQRSRRLFYKVHNDARTAGELRADNLYLSPKNMRERNARKVVVDPIGRIRRAGD